MKTNTDIKTLTQLCEQYLDAQLTHDDERRLSKLLHSQPELTDEQQVVLTLLDAQFPSDAEAIFADAATEGYRPTPKSHLRLWRVVAGVVAVAAALALFVVMGPAMQHPSDGQSTALITPVDSQPTHEVQPVGGEPTAPAPSPTAQPEQKPSSSVNGAMTEAEAIARQESEIEQRAAEVERLTAERLEQVYAEAIAAPEAHQKEVIVRTAEQRASVYANAQEEQARQQMDEIDRNARRLITPSMDAPHN